MASPSSQNKGPVFAVFVSEKGGAERREVYEATELSLGRVQGNDITLPKGNVSKRHARLLYRDARFIVTDLNSTNGTYVNRRRISHATIVREGDRIYIGDYVLRIELTDESERSSARHVVGGAVASQTPSSSRSELRSEGALGSGPLVSARPTRDAQHEVAVSRVPLAPRLPNIGGHTVASRPEPSEPKPATSSQALPSLPEPAVEDLATPEIHRQRQFLANLVAEVLRSVPAAELEGEVAPEVRERVGQVVDARLQALKEGESGQPSGLPTDQALRLVSDELFELGPIGPLLADPLVTAVTVSRFDRIHVERDKRYAPLPLPFTSEAALMRVIRRLCLRGGQALASGQPYVSRQLPDGTRLSVVLGEVSPQGAVVMLKRRRPPHRSVEELVRHGVVSRAMALFLHQCLQGRANILIAGSDDEGVASLVNGLCSICDDPSLYVVADGETFGLPKERTTSFASAELGTGAAQLFRTLRRGGAGRFVVDLADTDTCVALLSTAVEGMDGVLGAVRSPSLRRALSRLPAVIISKNPGLSAGAAREWVRTSFDIGLEVCRLADGRYRVLRIAELAGTTAEEVWLQDIFTFSIERTVAGGVVEGSFSASGTVPKIAAELASRGIDIDQSVFSRPPSR
ncbi:MAG: ATPase, T2SS/T4P/T4SS family [Polyangiaceae bacterium]|nr:ATPase, T2SS/T4P/T4SS family [Polyangiaceae bacterium]